MPSTRAKKEAGTSLVCAFSLLLPLPPPPSLSLSRARSSSSSLSVSLFGARSLWCALSLSLTHKPSSIQACPRRVVFPVAPTGRGLLKAKASLALHSSISHAPSASATCLAWTLSRTSRPQCSTPAQAATRRKAAVFRTGQGSHQDENSLLGHFCPYSCSLMKLNEFW